MHNEDFNRDIRELFECLCRLADSEPVRNSQVQGELGWSQRGRYARARDTLVASEVIRVLPGGKGGRLLLVSRQLPELHWLDVATERDLTVGLIAPLHDVLCEGDASTLDDDVEPEDVALAMTADMGKARTGGRFSRPDLVGAVRRRFTGFDALEIHTFEVKPYWSIDRVAVFEAVAQRALGYATHAWVALYLPNENVALRPTAKSEVAEARTRLKRIQRDVGEVGLGLVECSHLGPGGLKVLNTPHRYPADPEQLDKFLAMAAPGLLAQIGIEPATVTV